MTRYLVLQVKHYWDLLRQHPDGCPHGQDWADQPHRVMHLQAIFLQHFEEQQKAGHKHKHTRLFSLLPTMQGFTTNHVKLCSTGLYGLIKRSAPAFAARGLATFIPQTMAEFRAEDQYYWEQLFDTRRLVKGHREFARQLTTDGVSVCIIAQKTQPAPASSQPLASPQQRDSASAGPQPAPSCETTQHTAKPGPASAGCEPPHPGIRQPKDVNIDLYKEVSCVTFGCIGDSSKRLIAASTSMADSSKRLIATSTSMACRWPASALIETCKQMLIF